MERSEEMTVHPSAATSSSTVSARVPPVVVSVYAAPAVAGNANQISPPAATTSAVCSVPSASTRTYSCSGSDAGGGGGEEDGGGGRGGGVRPSSRIVPKFFGLWNAAPCPAGTVGRQA